MFGTGLFANVMPEKLARTLRLFRLADGLAGDPEHVEPGSFASIGALEVQHLEKWLMARPDLLGEELMIVASQFSGFDRTQDRPDLLAFDRRGKVVVIEIKRDTSGSGQDLQAIRYAAYVSTLTARNVVSLYQRYRKSQFEETVAEADATSQLSSFAGLDSLDAIDEDPVPRIILVARDYRPGVTSTALWLRRNFELDIKCVELTPYEVAGQTMLASTVLIPLPEAADFEVRMEEKRRRSVQRAGDRIDFNAATRFIASIPAGRWASYGDVAAAAGAPRGAQAVGTWLLTTEDDVPNVWRVLRRTGEVSEGWKGEAPGIPATPDDVRARLTSEGVTFDEAGRASQHQRWGVEEMAELEAEANDAGTPPLA